MTRPTRLFLLVTLSAMTAFVTFIARSERNRIALIDRKGFIVRGEKFGVSIGDSTQLAASILQRDGYEYVDTQRGGYCIAKHYAADVELLVYFDDSWRKTTVCVGTRDARVLSIQWNAGTFTPEL